MAAHRTWRSALTQLEMSGPPLEITCVDCGGRAHLVQPPEDDNEYEPGDVAVYRCEDCNDRWDVELTEDDFID